MRKAPTLTGELLQSVPDYTYTSSASYTCHSPVQHLLIAHPAGGSLPTGFAVCHSAGSDFGLLNPDGTPLPGAGGFVHLPITSDCGSCHTTVSWSGATGGPAGLVPDPNRTSWSTPRGPPGADRPLPGSTRGRRR